jgi:hypothetical protein
MKLDVSILCTNGKDLSFDICKQGHCDQVCV